MCPPKNIFVLLFVGFVAVSNAAQNQLNGQERRLAIIVEGFENVAHVARK